MRLFYVAFSKATARRVGELILTNLTEARNFSSDTKITKGRQAQNEGYCDKRKSSLSKGISKRREGTLKAHFRLHFA